MENELRDKSPQDLELLKLRLECLKFAWEFQKALPSMKDRPPIEYTMKRIWAIVEDREYPAYRPPAR